MKLVTKYGLAALTILVLLISSLSCSKTAPGQKTPAANQTTAPAAKTRPHPPVRTGDINVGSLVDATSQSINASGGTIAVSKPGDLLDGLVINIPPGSFSGSQPFKISYAPIVKHSFGEDFNPLTPLIKVANSGDYSEEIMKVTIPVKVPADSFAMGFIYDEKTKTLSGLPTLAQTATSITVGTRHFSDFLISMIPLTKLKSDIDSGFRPGIDDWQFTNRGSSVAKGGHCAGQSVTALWYYVTQPDGKDLTLYNRYDNNGSNPATPDLWQDDSLGYRFASTVHHDINWSSFENKFWTQLAGVNDDWTWKLFAYSIQLTGEPQEVGIFSNAGGGHDMICYRVKDGTLYIADPNYPGNTERRIEFKNGKFSPYNSGANADEIAKGNGKAYEKIEYCAKTTTVSWSKIAQRWAELKAGTVGNDTFPNYQIVYQAVDGKFPELKDGFTSPDKLIGISTSSNNTDTGCFVFRNGVQLKGDAKGNIELLPGVNKLGVYVFAKADAVDKNNNPIKVAKYIDFKYLNVNFEDNQCKSPPPKDMLEKLQKTTTFKCELLNLPTTIDGKGSMNRWVPGFKFTKHFYVPGNAISLGGTGAMPITWSGTSFSGGGATSGYPDKLNGSVCYNNGKLMVSFDYATNDPKDNLNMSVKNVPCDPKYFMDPKYAVDGKSSLQYMNTDAPVVKGLVTTLEWKSHEEQPTFNGPPEVWDAVLTAKDWSAKCGFDLAFR